MSNPFHGVEPRVGATLWSHQVGCKAHVWTGALTRPHGLYCMNSYCRFLCRQNFAKPLFLFVLVVGRRSSLPPYLQQNLRPSE